MSRQLQKFPQKECPWPFLRQLPGLPSWKQSDAVAFVKVSITLCFKMHNCGNRGTIYSVKLAREEKIWSIIALLCTATWLMNNWRKYLFLFIGKHICLYVSIWVYRICVCILEDVRSLRKGISGDYEPYDICPRNWIPVLCKSNKCFQLLSHLSTLILKCKRNLMHEFLYLYFFW